MRPLRVLLTTDVIGGVWDFCVTLAGEVVARGHEVVLLALGEPSTEQVGQAAHVGAKLIAEPLRLEWMQDSHADVLETQRLLARLVDELRPDVLHANQFAAATVLAPTVLTLHSDVLSWRKWTLTSQPNAAGQASAGKWSEPAEWQPYASLVRQALASADAIVAVSAFLAGEVNNLYGTAREIEVIHNGWPASTVERGPRQKQTLLAGRIWDAAKNIGFALHNVPSGARVVLAGEQRHPDSGGSVDVPAGVEALGFLRREELEERLGESRIYLSAARYDPFGLLPLQAALAGCALLLSHIPSYREVWGDAAVFFQPDNLTARWKWLLEDDAACADYARRARQRALERYSAARMADDYLAVYARVAAGVAV